MKTRYRPRPPKPPGRRQLAAKLDHVEEALAQSYRIEDTLRADLQQNKSRLIETTTQLATAKQVAADLEKRLHAFTDPVLKSTRYQHRAFTDPPTIEEAHITTRGHIRVYFEFAIHDLRLAWNRLDRQTYLRELATRISQHAYQETLEKLQIL